MAFSTEVYRPNDRIPHYAQGEWQSGHLVGDGTSVAFDNNGELGEVHNNVAIAGTVKFYDAGTGGTLDASTLVLSLSTAAVGRQFTGRIVVKNGLTVVTSAATADVSFLLRGRPTTSARTFGV